jgi:N-acetylmuramic acid 6-phosphate etherase
MDEGEFFPVTEAENPRTADISRLATGEIVRLMNEEDARVPGAVGRVLPDVARAVDGIVARLSEGGRLFYVGTGTSGRLGVLDASECPPTFGVPPELVQGIIAGGYDALHRATEASEDDRAAGAQVTAAVNAPSCRATRNCARARSASSARRRARTGRLREPPSKRRAGTCVSRS